MWRMYKYTQPVLHGFLAKVADGVQFVIHTGVKIHLSHNVSGCMGLTWMMACKSNLQAPGCANLHEAFSIGGFMQSATGRDLFLSVDVGHSGEWLLCA